MKWLTCNLEVLFFFCVYFYSLPTDAMNNSAHRELKNRIKCTTKLNSSCASLHTFWRRESPLQICFSIIRLDKCLCKRVRDNRRRLHYRAKCDCNNAASSSDGYAFVAYLLSVRVLMHWSIAWYNTHCVYVHLLFKENKASTIYLYINSYITKKLKFKINVFLG